MRGAIFGFAALGLTIVSAVLFILMGIVFFFINLWIIKVAAGFAGFSNVDGNWIILTAGILSAASVIAASFRR